MIKRQSLLECHLLGKFAEFTSLVPWFVRTEHSGNRTRKYKDMPDISSSWQNERLSGQFSYAHGGMHARRLILASIAKLLCGWPAIFSLPGKTRGSPGNVPTHVVVCTLIS
ncbi:hypothetical protein PoB_003271000 [Plakobranchus ocellatus]|uniref:Uncharacterized protein n=1 Tax=Plakobranchus ocellatus TaxID=259542 RepID=A0AAV4ADG5_9GAST|nr:hypothetical protein PoB_003271000 [Plakobranchus ocellatus]